MSESPEASTGKCLVCGAEISAPIVWCCDCATPQHADCFTYNGGCGRYGCIGRRPRSALHWRRGPLPVYAADKDKRRFLASYIIRFWPPRKLFAAFFAGVGAAGALLAFALFKPTHFREPGSLNTALALGAMFVLSLVYALRVDDYWIIDSKTSTIWLRRAGIWQLSLRAKAKFSECDGVRLVRLRFDEGPDQWAVSVVLADKTDFTVKQSEDREEMSAVAKQLSGLIGVQLSIS